MALIVDLLHFKDDFSICSIVSFLALLNATRAFALHFRAFDGHGRFRSGLDFYHGNRHCSIQLVAVCRPNSAGVLVGFLD